jgi:hypothetical protein
MNLFMSTGMKLQVLGVHPVPDAPDPCHLVDLSIETRLDREGRDLFDATTITQAGEGHPGTDWQTAHDIHLVDRVGGSGRLLEPGELAELRVPLRIAFFFHFLRLDRPLLTASGPVWLPRATPRPDYLRFVVYPLPQPASASP